MGAIIRMNHIRVRSRLSHQRFTSSSGDGFVGAVNIEHLLCPGINHPKDFLDVVRHLLEFLLPGLQYVRGCAFLTSQLTGDPGHQKNKANDCHCKSAEQKDCRLWSYTGNENNAQEYQCGEPKSEGCRTADTACALFRQKQISRLANFIHSLTPQRSGLREIIRPTGL